MTQSFSASYMDIDEHIESGARPADIHSSGELEDPDFEIRQKSGYLTKRGERVKVLGFYNCYPITTISTNNQNCHRQLRLYCIAESTVSTYTDRPYLAYPCSQAM